ncbi:hypothetical protein Q9L42_016975 [Methylomarinum sp. Ch1-1]|uniref:Uncharacterized protein n=1 Tax=Methylomarinum roseum TaxID=3067653 RepID=A0AAU7NTU4_9GAMM|nr:hypothetical protein [Methylomarinum sp. Ch1-1]MDP4519979.1 hypothetical protein [Methylomarinum sp. Ch1-1]
MTTENNQLAEKVVTAFKSVLTDEALSHISEQEFHQLNLIVREALSQHLGQAATLVEGTARQLRDMTDHQDIGL